MKLNRRMFMAGVVGTMLAPLLKHLPGLQTGGAIEEPMIGKWRRISFGGTIPISDEMIGDDVLTGCWTETNWAKTLSPRLRMDLDAHEAETRQMMDAIWGKP